METNWDRVGALIDQLYSSSDELEYIFPGRKFTLDGHLVGSVGEVVVAFMFDLELNPASTIGHDAYAKDGRKVEIKLTQGKSVAIRHKPEHLIVLARTKATNAPSGTSLNRPKVTIDWTSNDAVRFFQSRGSYKMQYNLVTKCRLAVKRI